MPDNSLEEYGKIQWTNGFAIGFSVGTLVTIYGYLLIKLYR
jgi:hypothetical protein